MKVALTGSSGLVGTRLSEFLTQQGHTVVPVVRRQPRAGEVHWDPAHWKVDAAGLEGLNAVINLAGENIAARRWSLTQKQRIRDSRVQGTSLLSETLAGLDSKPQVLISASATGFYGDRGDQWLDEQSSPGAGFLPEVCQQWEAATHPARDAGIRVVNPRLGMVLSRKGGALAKMLPLFRLGGGGIVGSGRQYWSWIAIEDVCGAIGHFLGHATISGPVNLTSPNPSTNREFTTVLARVLGRPAWVPAPAFMLRLALGELADALLLASVRVRPGKLQESGFAFAADNLDQALRMVLAE